MILSQYIIVVYFRRSKMIYIMQSIFFFFKQKTAYEMRISDWSSDVCSSDLVRREAAEHDGMHGADTGAGQHRIGGGRDHRQVDGDAVALLDAMGLHHVAMRQTSSCSFWYEMFSAFAGSSPSQMIAVWFARLARWRSMQIGRAHV